MRIDRRNLFLAGIVAVITLLCYADGLSIGYAQSTNSGLRFRRSLSPSALIAQKLVQDGDQNGDQRISQSELRSITKQWFHQLNPDAIDQLPQEEFLRRLGLMLPSTQSRRPRSTTPHLGFFLAIDQNKDATLTAQEWNQQFDRWFDTWNDTQSPGLTQSAITEGLEAAMPRTNMTGALGGAPQSRIPGLPTPPPSPVLNPTQAMKTIQLGEDSFHLELMASEPTIQDPISISFDADGNVYVLEMRNYMLDLKRTGERDPIARISLLKDTNRDGTYDHVSIFLDQLINPRTISAYRDGVFFVADAKLYHARDNDGDGRADHTELLDANYGGGNIEHAPNGMMPAMDNWIYNARSQRRYRWINNTLIVQPTENRGQWGITQDNFGRLLFNVNNSQLLGDYAPSNYLNRNPNYNTSAGLNLFVSTDQRVFSGRMNTGINRGYSKDVLDEQGRAYVFASSCGPVIYRGNNFPSDFVGNAFVCDPALNLIKRNLVFDSKLTLSSRFAYSDREFVTSTDERFRPVNAFNAPDGTLWIVDMYRGISQYGIFMTDYLKAETLERNLQQGIHLGRLYRIVSSDKKPMLPLSLSSLPTTTLVQHLGHANGWIRDTAQRLLVERREQAIAPLLAQIVQSDASALHRIHALWAIEGIYIEPPEVDSPSPNTHSTRLISLERGRFLESPALPPSLFATCVDTLFDADPKVQTAAIRTSELLSHGSSDRQARLLKQLEALTNESIADETLFQSALSTGNLPKPDAIPLLAKIAALGTQHLIIRDAVMSGLKGWELQFLQYLLTSPDWLHARPGRSALLEALSMAITKEANPTKVELTLNLVAQQQAPEQIWRQRPLIDGMATTARSRAARKIRWKEKPPILESLRSAIDPTLTDRFDQASSHFEWGDVEQSDTSTDDAPRGENDEKIVVAGHRLYEQICAGCHGLDGEGLKPLAPPLADSDWLSYSSDRLIRILLHGLTGPISINGSRYAPPEILPEMPSVGVLDDAQIAAVLTYISTQWSPEPSNITSSQVASIRAQNDSRTTPWTESELLQFE